METAKHVPRSSRGVEKDMKDLKGDGLLQLSSSVGPWRMLDLEYC